MLIHEYIIWNQTTLTIEAHNDRPRVSKERGSALFWVSLGWYGCGAKLKLVIWELCGSSRRADGSPDMVVTERARLVLKENRSWPVTRPMFWGLAASIVPMVFGFSREMTDQRRRGGMVSKEALVRCLSGWGVRGGAVRYGVL